MNTKVRFGSAALGGVVAASVTWAAFQVAAGSETLPNQVATVYIARDGFPPTRTPTPTPIPVPPAHPQCYEPRAAVHPGFDYRPADGDSVFASCQVIAYYGYPGVPGLGVLGQGETAAMIARLKAEVVAYDAANGPRTAVGALHLIAAVAQANATADGSWLYRMPAGLIEEQLALAEAEDLVVILDVQMGHSTVDVEIPPLLPYLQNPRVHLALDPEWAMPPGVAPGETIGGMDASAINRAQELMSDYIAEHGLTNRMLVVHQFTPGMIRNKEALAYHPGVDLVVDMDGFGGQEIKLAHYKQFIKDDSVPHGGLKLFYDPALDINLLTPAQVSVLLPQPDLVVFQ